MDDPQEDHLESQDIAQETPVEGVFIPPSIDRSRVLSGESYTHHCAIPTAVASDPAAECVLGVDEAGRGPVLGTYRPHICTVHQLICCRSNGLRPLLPPTEAPSLPSR